MSSISPKDAKLYIERWALANQREIEELRATPIAVKLRQLISLMASASVFHDSVARRIDEEEVRARWQKIKSAYRV